ncbi:MAG: catalase [Akkermansia sp.]|nr:catalase [Akkermansia sp.]
MSDPHKLTTAAGAPVADNTNSMTAGPRGPMLLQDVWHLEKMAHLNREVLPERRMHAKGWGAHGKFTVTQDMTPYTKAALFSKVGKVTPVFARFSTAAGERGYADADRDIRGFALKFYTDEGNWDLVGNNTPVFFIRDPLKFPDLNHALHRHPQTGHRSDTAKWDFWTSLPESFHQVTITMSERGIPSDFRHMHGFGSHAYSFINAAGERVWCKFHFVSQQGIRCLSDAEADTLNGKDPDSAGHDLFNAIAEGNFPKWTLCVQLMTDKQAQAFPFNPFDLTKVWPHGDFPLREVGVLELNRNPENYFAEVEQAAFTPANIVPGIGFSPDKMLQSRLFSYGDAQRYRLGVNHDMLPINRPRCPFHSFHQDGRMRFDDNKGAAPTYEPNSFGEWREQPLYNEPPIPVDGMGERYTFLNTPDDYFAQPRALFKLMPTGKRRLLFENTARALDNVPLFIKRRHVDHCYACHPDYGRGVEKALEARAAGAEK